MWPESTDNRSLNQSTVSTPSVSKLRTGLTTGTCATACVISAIHLLLGKIKSKQCEVILPRGKIVSLDIEKCQMLNKTTAYASTIKDAGDDPDVTHGATVFVQVRLLDSKKIIFNAAEGVGIVTRPGLALKVGEPAINVTPRQMIRQHLEQLNKLYDYSNGFDIAIGIHNGKNIAKKTMNARLGILGGLSILGTTGIVRPFSCAAYIASIHQGIDVAHANNISHVAACTGNLSENFARESLKLEDMAILEMGDFAGAVFKYIKQQPIAKLSICGGFGKITKLAYGHTDLHNKKSAINFDFLAQCAAQVGIPEPSLRLIQRANTSIEVLSIIHSVYEQQQTDTDLSDKFINLICHKAWQQVKNHCHNKNNVLTIQPAIDIWTINRQGIQIGQYIETSES